MTDKSNSFDTDKFADIRLINSHDKYKIAGANLVTNEYAQYDMGKDAERLAGLMNSVN